MARGLSPFRHVLAARQRRSVFSNSYYKVFDCNLGQLIPVMCDLYLPGDHVRISCEDLIRANPLAAPIMHQIDIKCDYFWVPLRLLWPKPEYRDLDDNLLPYPPDVPGTWEEFITGGHTGKLEFAQPKWANPNLGNHQLWDYFGFPLVNPVGRTVNAWPKRAYNLVYNEYYRDSNLENPIDLDTDVVQKAKYEKDYFTSALPEPGIRGQMPAVPLTGVGSVNFSMPVESRLGDIWTVGMVEGSNRGLDALWQQSNPSSGVAVPRPQSVSSSIGGDIRMQYGVYTNINTNGLLNNNSSLDLGGISFTINDLRRINALQIFMERSMRAGSRYTEYLMAHWGVTNNDLKLMRPAYIGGTRNPFIVSEVLQTSKSEPNAPVGYMGGHGIGAGSNYVGSYYCQEHGVVIGILRLMPKPVYQQGINRQWLYDDRFEYPTVEFSNLGEQEIYNMELCATTNAAFNVGIFGFQGRYDEHRVKNNMVAGVMRNGVPNTLGFWHLARYFDTANPPALNKAFLDVEDDGRYRAVQSLPGFIVTHGNRVRRVAPLPAIAVPSLAVR